MEAGFSPSPLRERIGIDLLRRPTGRRGLDGWVVVEPARSAAPGKGVHARVVPDVRPIASELAELDVVDARNAGSGEYEDEFVLGAIE